MSIPLYHGKPKHTPQRGGWNFVDFRSSQSDSIQTFQNLTDGWRNDIRKNTEIKLETMGENRGSWFVKGLSAFTDEEANWAMTLFLKGIDYRETIAKAKSRL